MKRVLILLISFALLQTANAVFAGELSTFEIIGFNNNMTYMAFSEYGLLNGANPYANLYIVDIENNRFLPNGVYENTFPETSSLEENGKSGFLAQLLHASNSLKQYNINPLNTGRLIYVLLDGDEPGDNLSFTDFKTNTNYSVTLNQKIVGTGVNASGAFDLSVSINGSLGNTSYTVGNRKYYRSVALYRIRSIYTTLNDRSLIFLIEKQSFDSEGEINIHYMVETLTWR